MAPIAFILYWLLFIPKGRLRWTAPFLWLAFPVAYVVLTFVRGAATGTYPYPFLDVGALGWPAVVLNILGLLGLFLMIGFAVLYLDRILARRAAAIAESKY